jgi:hypothetical protein
MSKVDRIYSMTQTAISEIETVISKAETVISEARTGIPKANTVISPPKLPGQSLIGSSQGPTWLSQRPTG